jgi:hypothetical protein
MPFRTTIVIPERLHDRLRPSMRSLILRAVGDTYTEPKKDERVTGPLIRTKGKLGPRFPVDENPWDLVFY